MVQAGQIEYGRILAPAPAIGFVTFIRNQRKHLRKSNEVALYRALGDVKLLGL